MNETLTRDQLFDVTHLEIATAKQGCNIKRQTQCAFEVPLNVVRRHNWQLVKCNRPTKFHRPLRNYPNLYHVPRPHGNVSHTSRRSIGDQLWQLMFLHVLVCSAPQIAVAFIYVLTITRNVWRSFVRRDSSSGWQITIRRHPGGVPQHTSSSFPSNPSRHARSAYRDTVPWYNFNLLHLHTTSVWDWVLSWKKTLVPFKWERSRRLTCEE